jgi:hypothetical protein
MTALVRALALAGIVAAVAGSAAAQMPTSDQMHPTFQADANVSVLNSIRGAAMSDQPMAPSECLDGRPGKGPAPKVVRTMPAPGSVVRPGSMVLSVTFDRPMACKANLAVSPFPIPCPDGAGAVLMSPDRLTLTTVCEVEAGASYSMPLADFIGDGGIKSERYDLAFTTSTEAPLTDARQAQALEKAGPARR